MSWVVVAMLAAAPTTIAVDAETTCAPREVLQRELRRASVQFVEGGAALTVRLTPEGAAHRLVVREASGAAVIERVLPTASCQEAGVAAALIIDRALRDIVVKLPKEATAKDATAKEATAKDATAKDATAKDATAKDASAKDATAKDATAKDASAKDSTAKDSTAKDATAKDATTKDATTKDATAKDASAKDSTAKDSTAKDASAKDSTAKGATAKGATAKDASAKGATAKDASAKDARKIPTSRDTTSRDTTSRDTTSRDTTSRDTTSRDTAARDTTARDTTSRDTTSRDTTPRDTTSRDTTSRDTAARDTTARDTTSRDSTARDSTARDSTARDSTSRGTNPRDDTPPIPPRAIPRDTTPRDTTPRDTTPRDTTARDTTPRDTTPRDTTPRDTPARDAALKTTAAPDTSRPSPEPLKPAFPPPTLVASATASPLRSTHVFVPEPMESTLRSLRFEAAAGAGIDAPTPSTVSALLSADAALHFSPWRFGLLAAFSFGGSTPVLDDVTGRERGTLTARSLFLLPHAMVCLDRTVSLCGGLRAGARIAIGSAAGDYIFQTKTVLAPTPTTGLGGRLAFAVGPVLFALDLSALVNLTTPMLEVQGLTTTIATPRFELLVALSAGGTTR